ncbi:MAG: sulfotransferase [bacterium]|nr:sulfotransferase [bacterium]
MNNILLTGLPRSGTTLMCNLLGELPDTVALHEPLEVAILPTLERPDGVIAHLDGFFCANRKSLLEQGLASSKHIDGKIPTNPFSEKQPLFGKRKERSQPGVIRVNKPLGSDFLLAIKHPAAITALIEDLRERYRIFATVRNPLSVLCSWSSLPVPVSKGFAPAAEELDLKLRTDLAALPSVLDRQVHLLCWFFERYIRLLPREQVIRYEDLVQSDGRTLGVITPYANKLECSLESRNANKLYDPAVKQRAGAALLALDDSASCWKFYDKGDIEQLLAISNQV